MQTLEPIVHTAIQRKEQHLNNNHTRFLSKYIA